jgi:amidase
VGLYPSRGRESIGPEEGEHGFGMAQALAVTRTIRDTAMMLDCLGKPMPGDPYVIARPQESFSYYLNRSKRRFRIGWSAQPLMDAPVDPETAAAAKRAARVLSEHGCDVEEAQPTINLAAMDEGCKNIWYLGFDEHLDELGRLAGRKVGPDTVSRATLRFYEFAKKQTADAFFKKMDDFNRMRREAARFFMRYDVWLSPTCAQVAQPNGIYGMDVDLPPDEFLKHEQRPCQFLVPYNVWGQPAISLPLAMHSSGLPIGLQLGARHAEEHVLIELGSLLEQVMPWHSRKPPLHADASTTKVSA